MTERLPASGGQSRGQCDTGNDRQEEPGQNEGKIRFPCAAHGDMPRAEKKCRDCSLRDCFVMIKKASPNGILFFWHRDGFLCRRVQFASSFIPPIQPLSWERSCQRSCSLFRPYRKGSATFRLKSAISGPIKKAVMIVPMFTSPKTLTPPILQSTAPRHTQIRSQMIRQY